MADAITVETPQPPAGDLIQPVVDVSTRVAHIEEQQVQHTERLARDLADLENRVTTASSSQVAGLEERINNLSARLEELSSRTVQPVEEIPAQVDGAVEMTAPEIAPSEAPPEKRKRGLHGRKREKRRNKRTAA